MGSCWVSVLTASQWLYVWPDFPLWRLSSLLFKVGDCNELWCFSIQTHQYFRYTPLGRHLPLKADVTDTHLQMWLCNNMRQSTKQSTNSNKIFFFLIRISGTWIQVMNQGAWTLLFSSPYKYTPQPHGKKLWTECVCSTWERQWVGLWFRWK